MAPKGMYKGPDLKATSRSTTKHKERSATGNTFTTSALAGLSHRESKENMRSFLRGKR